MKQNLIGGQWTEGVRTYQNTNPSDTRDVIGDYAVASREQALEAVAAAHAAFPAWSLSTPQQRFDILDAVGNEIIARKAELGDLLAREEGKTLPEAIGEVGRAAAIFKFFAGEALRPGGEVLHRYVLGLYEVLGRIFGPRPQVLLESCASGGNRFDLGMLCFSPQIWASDCTDPIERLSIQLGLSYLYPQSTMGAHVTASPSEQTLRATPLSTRFNVAALGLLGYELDPRTLTPSERKEIRGQIAFYKAHRRSLQYGRLRRHDPVRPDQTTVSVHWVGDGEPALIGHYQTRLSAAAPPEWLPITGLAPEARYASQWVFEELVGAPAIAAYLRGKMATVRDKARKDPGVAVRVEMGRTAEGSRGRPCAFMTQGQFEEVQAAVIFEVEGSRIVRYDLCIPQLLGAVRTGVFPL